MARTAPGGRPDRTDRALWDLIDAEHRAREARLRRRRYWLAHQARETATASRTALHPACCGAACSLLDRLHRMARSGTPVLVVLEDGTEIAGILPTAAAADVLLA